MAKSEFLEIPKVSELSERDCAILGAIGQVGVLSGVSGLYGMYRGLPPHKNRESEFAIGGLLYKFRPATVGQVEGVITKCAQGVDRLDDERHTAKELGMLTRHGELDHMARLALRYHAGLVPHEIAPETQEELEALTDYYTAQSSDLIAIHRSAGSTIVDERKLLGTLKHEISYYIQSD